jgi:hypothetical protein
MSLPTPTNIRERFRMRRRASDRRPIPGLAVIPALMTLGNLLCGFAAIHYAAMPVATSEIFGWSTLTVAGCLIFSGMFLDALDGSVARLTRSTSDLGAQLDSLADMVAFGVAPAFMMLRLVSHYYGPEHYTGVLGPDADNLSPPPTSAAPRCVWRASTSRRSPPAPRITAGSAACPRRAPPAAWQA